MRLGDLMDRVAGRTPRAATPEPDGPVVAIGDIHGCADLLDRLLDRLDGETPGVPLVFLGDYVDRGDDSAAVLRRLADLPATWPAPVTCLMGNHERMMLDFLGAPADRGARWFRSGGVQTLASFGIGSLADTSAPADAADAAARLHDAMGAGLAAWLEGLALQHVSGNVHFVHAAADPDLPMDAQRPDTLLWGHPAFAAKPRRDGQIVVHGHTVVDTPRVDGGRVAVDTGAWFTGRLTAARIVPDGIAFVTA